MTPLLSGEWIDTIGEMMYLVSLFASLAIAYRMWGIWRQYGTELASGILALSLIFAAYWLFCLVRIHLGCLSVEPLVGSFACNEMAWWTRISMAATLSAVAVWLWRK
jgi:hypothetical protein